LAYGADDEHGTDDRGTDDGYGTNRSGDRQGNFRADVRRDATARMATARKGRRAGSSPVSAHSPTRNTWLRCRTTILRLIIKKGGAYMGKIAAMPAWEHKFNDEQVDTLVAHIRTFTGTAEKK
jgi:hypothetical protein